MSEIPKWVNKYVGIPYKDRGRDYEGVDCFGIVQLVLLEEFQKFPPDYADYTDRATLENRAAYISNCLCDGKWIRVDGQVILPGDMLLFRILNIPCHVGLVINDTHMLHCQKGTNSCIERYTTMSWGRRLVGAFRFE